MQRSLPTTGLMIGFIVWIVLITFPFLTLEFHNRQIADNPHITFSQMIGVTAYLLGAALVVGPTLAGQLFSTRLWNRTKLVTLLTGLIFATTLLAGAPVKSLMYVVLTWGVVLSLANVAQFQPQITRQFLLCLAAIAGIFCVASFLLHGAPAQNRFVGGIHPNFFAQTALAGIFAYCLAMKRNNTWAIIVGLAVILLVNSRSSLIGLAVYVFFSSLFPIYFHRISKSQRSLLLISSVILAMALIALAFNNQSVSSIIINIFALDDPHRGLGTGFTGRTLLWLVAAANIAAQPLVGYGFRASTSIEGFYTDTAYINIIVDMGLPVGLILIGAFLYSVTVRFVALRRLTSLQEITFQSKILAVQISALCVMLFQPYYINIGNLWSIVFILALFAPNSDWYPIHQRKLYYRFIPRAA